MKKVNFVLLMLMIAILTFSTVNADGYGGETDDSYRSGDADTWPMGNIVRVLKEACTAENISATAYSMKFSDKTLLAEIDSVAVTADVKAITFRGKNLYSGNWEPLTIDGTYYGYVYRFAGKAGKTYCISVNADKSNPSAYTYLYSLVDGTLKGISAATNLGYNSTFWHTPKGFRYNSLTFTMKTDAEIVIVGVSGGRYDSDAASRFCELQIEESHSRTAYAPYWSKTITIPEAVRALEGYGESSGSDVNTLDFTNMVYHEVGHYVDGVWTAHVQNIDISSYFSGSILCLPEAAGAIVFEQQQTSDPVAFTCSLYAISTHKDYPYYCCETGQECFTDYDALIAAYDELVLKHPSMIQKRALSAGDVTETVCGNTIYEYTIGRPQFNETGPNIQGMDDAFDKPLFAILTGLHGTERGAPTSLYMLVKDMLEGNANVSTILGNAVLKIIPCLNPDGFNSNKYNNRNISEEWPDGVNLNNNFDANWKKGYNLGPSAASENEIQIAQAWIAEVINAGAKFCLDIHNLGYSATLSPVPVSSDTFQIEEFMMITHGNGAAEQKFKKVYIFATERIKQMMCNVYGIPEYIPQSDDYPRPIYRFTYGATNEGTAMSFAYMKKCIKASGSNAIAAAMELSNNVLGDGVKYTPTTVAAGATILGNMFVAYTEMYINEMLQ